MIKLLLVEDDENLNYIIKGSLEDMIGGYEVLSVLNGEEGLKVWRDFKPDIIVSDVEMPVIDGNEMVRAIREIDGDIPIVFATAKGSPKDVTIGYHS
jgi:CheY-like chemotaxis protein